MNKDYARSMQDDTISRKAVDKIINDLLENDSLQASPSVWHGLHMIKQLPSAQPEPQWIPCSERLPNGQTEVIVSCCDDAGDSKYNYTSFGWMTRDGEYWIVDNEINYYVNAWMPLPEPWKGEQE